MNAEFFALAFSAALNPKLLGIDLLLTENRRPRAMFLCLLLGGMTVALRFSFYAGMDIGRDNGNTVDRAYRDKAPYAFTGTVKKVVFDLKPEPHEHEKTLHETAHHDAVGAAMSG